MAQKKKRPNARERRNGFMINILTLIVLILLVFEGKSLISLFSSQTIQDRIKQEESEVFAGANLTEAQTEPQSEATGESTSSGKTETGTDEQKEASSETQKAADTDLSTGLPDDDASYLDVVVPAQDTPVDDSYFEDAVFIGDSRMQGFRNLSGITKCLDGIEFYDIHWLWCSNDTSVTAVHFHHMVALLFFFCRFLFTHHTTDHLTWLVESFIVRINHHLCQNCRNRLIYSMAQELAANRIL